jgi:hypothetical protein
MSVQVTMDMETYKKNEEEKLELKNELSQAKQSVEDYYSCLETVLKFIKTIDQEPDLSIWLNDYMEANPQELDFDRYMGICEIMDSIQ